MNFVTEIGPQIECSEPYEGEDGVVTELLNYRTTLNIFKFYESVMAKQIVYWQFARQMYAHDDELPLIDREALLAASSAIVEDAKFRISTVLPPAAVSSPV